MASADRAVVKTRLVSGSQAEVWKAWATAEGAKTFFAPNARVELRPQGRYEILFDASAAPGLQGSEGCQVLSYVPERMLSFSWNAPPQFPSIRAKRTFVVVELQPKGNQTQVTLTHGGWGEGAEWDAVYAYFGRAWEVVLDNLEARFVKGPIAWPKVEPLPVPAAQVHPVIAYLGRFVGGVWSGTVEGPDGPMIVEFEYEWTEDKLGVRGKGVIGKGRKDAVHVRNSFGLDRLTGGVYYLDTHNSDQVYYGAATLDGQDLVFEFGPAGGNPAAFNSRGTFLEANVYGFKIKDKDGKEQVGAKLTRRL